MKTFAALLRGINVGGNNIIAMSSLKEMFVKLKYENVVTYVNSGNVIFSSKETEPQQIELKIRKAIEKEFDLDVDVFVLGIEEMKKILSRCPYDSGRLKKGENIYFTLMSDAADKEGVEKLKSVSYEHDELTISGSVIYLLIRGGYAKTVYNNNFFEKTLHVKATSRNINTIKKIIDIGSGLQ